MTSASLWFAAFGGRYTGSEPGWFNPADFPWTARLEAKWQVIRDEVLALTEAAEGGIDPYFVHAMVFPPRSWRTRGLTFWGWRIHRNISRCPRTMAVLESLPGFVGASISALDPGANINPHQGDTNAVIRIHLPLVVPGGLPDCGFQVGGEARPWIEGKPLLFLDARTHFAWNATGARRYVLIIDVLRPEFEDRRGFICANVLASILMQGLASRAPWINRAPGALRYGLHVVARWGIRLALPLQRRRTRAGTSAAASAQVKTSR